MADPNDGRPIEILLVEDNPGDIRLTEEALREGKVCNNLHVVMDGVAAMTFVRGIGEYAQAPRPDLILLDLNLPKKDGREVLAEIKANPDLKQMPVVVLTTSSAEKDILASYRNHANCYITKPVDVQQFFEAIRVIEDFWLTIVKLPAVSEHAA